MNQAVQRRLARGLPLAGLAAGIGVSLLVMQRAGGSAFGALWCWLAGLLLVGLPGFVLSGILHRDEPAPVRGTAALVWGLAAFALAAVLGSVTGVHLLVWLPALAAAVYMVMHKSKVVVAVKNLRLWPLAVWGVAVLLCSLSASAFAHPSAVGAVTPSQDFFWNLGNVQSFLNGMPPQDLRFSGVVLRYHYLTELLYAGLCMGTGLPAYDVTAFYGAPLMLAGAVFALYNLATGLLEKTYQRALCVCGLFVLGCAGLHKLLDAGMSPFWNSGIQHLLTNINAHTTTVLLLAAFALLYHTASKTAFSMLRAEFWSAAVCFALLCMTKGPVAGIVAIAAAGTALVLALRRERTAGMLVFGLGLAAGFAALYFGFFAAGASSSMAFSPSGTLEKSWFVNYIHLFSTRWPVLRGSILLAFAVLQTFCFCPPVFVGWLLGLWRDLRGLVKGEISALRLLANAAAVGGFAAFYLFDHYAMSQVYFAFCGMFFMALLAVDNLSHIRAKTLKALLAVLAAVSAATGLCTWAYLARDGVQLLRDGGASMRASASADPARLSLTADEEAAMHWLAEQPDGLFATNRIHTGAALEGLSNVYSGMSGRGAYMESFKYAVSNMGVPEEEVLQRIAWVETLFSADTTYEQATQLCREAGVRYVVFREDAPGSEAAFAHETPAFTSDDARIYVID